MVGGLHKLSVILKNGPGIVLRSAILGFPRGCQGRRFVLAVAAHAGLLVITLGGCGNRW
jgi:hypothetical protein